LSTLAIPFYNGSSFTASVPEFGGIYLSESFRGGDYQGTLDGTTALASYSVDDTDGSFPNNISLDAAVTTDGTTFGTAVPNAGAIAWLLTNLGEKVDSADAQGALQAAIFRTEYGASGFQLDGTDNNTSTDNDATLIADYKADLAALGSNVAPLSNVDWISPTYPDSTQTFSALVALPVGEVEPVTLPNTSVPDFHYTELNSDSGQFDDMSSSAGNFLGTLDGTTKLTASYCVSIDLPLATPSTYNAIVDNYGAIYGELVPNAGSIAWLVTNLGPSAKTADQQNALQAAIWHEEYGKPDFQLDGADNGNSGNDATLIADYKADLKALGNQTTPVGSVIWFNPIAGELGNVDQGLVGLAAVTYSTKATVASSVTPAAYGRIVTFGATVSNVTAPGGPTPTGSVQFEIDGAHFGKPVPLSTKGTATVTESTLGVGTYTINAVYIPTGNFTGITSPNYMQTISPDVIAVSVKSSLNPAPKNKAVSFTAIVANKSAGSSAVPLGTVVFKIDGQTKGSVKLSGGKAVLSGIKLAAGTHTVTVYYTPLNTDFNSGQGQLKGNEKVNR
jgi:hypothetical protein